MLFRSQRENFAKGRVRCGNVCCARSSGSVTSVPVRPHLSWAIHGCADGHTAGPRHPSRCGHELGASRKGGRRAGWAAPCPGKSITVHCFPWSLQRSWNRHQFSDTWRGVRLRRGEGVGRGNTALKSEIRHLPLLSAVEGGPGRRRCVSPCTPAMFPGGRPSGCCLDILSGSPPWPGLGSHL